MRKSNSDHSSSSPFSIGVPVKHRRWSLASLRTASCARERWFLIACASSRIDAMISLRVEVFGVAQQDRIRGHARRRCRAPPRRRELRSLPCSTQQRHARRELRELALPVADQAGRRHDQRRPRGSPALVLETQMRDRLQRLAEPHVVGEHAAGLVLAQMLQPRHALALVRPQARAQTARRLCSHWRRCDRARALAQAGRARQLQGRGVERRLQMRRAPRRARRETRWSRGWASCDRRPDTAPPSLAAVSASAPGARHVLRAPRDLDEARGQATMPALVRVASPPRACARAPATS